MIGAPGGSGGFAPSGVGGAGGGVCGDGPEVCNGIDDDCDGLVDENMPRLTCGCGIVGPSCAAGTPVTCADLVQHRDICGNGIDDDCDGLVDCADPDCTEPRLVYGAEVWSGKALPLRAGGYVALVFGQVQLPENHRGWLLHVDRTGGLVDKTELGYVFAGQLVQLGDGSFMALTMGLSGIVLHTISATGTMTSSTDLLPRSDWLSAAAIDPSDGSLALLLTGDSAAQGTVRFLLPGGSFRVSTVDVSKDGVRSMQLVSTSKALMLVRGGDAGVEVARVAKDTLADLHAVDTTPVSWLTATAAEDGSLLVLTQGEALHVAAGGALSSRFDLPGSTIWSFPDDQAGGLVLSWQSPSEGLLYAASLPDLDGPLGPARSLGPGDAPLWIDPLPAGQELLAIDLSGPYRGVAWSVPGGCL